MSQTIKGSRLNECGIIPSTSFAVKNDRKRRKSSDILESCTLSENISATSSPSCEVSSAKEKKSQKKEKSGSNNTKMTNRNGILGSDLPEARPSSSYKTTENNGKVSLKDKTKYQAENKSRTEHRHRSRSDSPKKRRNRSKSPANSYYNQRSSDRNKRTRNNTKEKMTNHKRDPDDEHYESKSSRSSIRGYSSTNRRCHDKRDKNRNKFNEDDDKPYEWGKPTETKNNDEPKQEKEKPNFGLSGALLEDTNKVNGVIVKYSEPPEARKPKRRWRLYPFKGETALPILHIHRQSCFLVGRDRKVVDLPVDHPSCSKQHAALQYRLVPFDRDDGSVGKRVRLYLIDLESANGTFVNGSKLEPRKYYELIEKDIIKFGFSTREYVLLHENSKEDQEDDDVVIKNENKPLI